MQQIDRILDAGMPQASPAPQSEISGESVVEIFSQVLARWYPALLEASIKIAVTMDQKFPEEACPADFWQSESSGVFTDLFVWRHVHELVQPFRRQLIA